MGDVRHISYSFVVYLALVEGLALTVLYNYNGPLLIFMVGFIPMLIVLAFYKLTNKYLPIKINEKAITSIPILILSIANGLFMVILAFVQDYLTFLDFGLLGDALFGFLSVMIAFLVLWSISCLIFKLKFNLGVPLYAGIFEFFILPLMFLIGVFFNWSFLIGTIAGLIGGFIGLFISNKFLEKYPIRLKKMREE